jgi:hypothetical protein
MTAWQKNVLKYMILRNLSLHCRTIRSPRSNFMIQIEILHVFQLTTPTIWPIKKRVYLLATTE